MICTLQVAALGVPYVLMHMRGGDLAKMQDDANTRYGCTWRDVGSELQSSADRAMMAGIPAWNIILDPGKFMIDPDLFIIQDSALCLCNGITD